MIFGIGLSKTGTVSLNTALRKLHYNAIHWPCDEQYLRELKEGRLDLTIYGMYDAVTDAASPCLMYPELSELYPNAKFILTVREEITWVESIRKHISHEKKFPLQTRLAEAHRMLVYGSAELSEQLWLRRFKEHNKAVRQFFQGSNRFLEMNIVAGDGWDKLCPFLGKDIPNIPFPHKNKAK